MGLGDSGPTGDKKPPTAVQAQTAGQGTDPEVEKFISTVIQTSELEAFGSGEPAANCSGSKISVKTGNYGCMAGQSIDERREV